MLGVAATAFPMGVLASVLNGRPMFGLQYCLDTGLIFSLPVLLALSLALSDRGRPRPFLAGFVAVGWAAVIAYIAFCALLPEFTALPVQYYINWIEPVYTDADTWALYSVSLVVRGAIMAVPQFSIALIGGCLASLAARCRLNEAAVGFRQSSRPNESPQQTRLKAGR
jgi:hypothetical protein